MNKAPCIDVNRLFTVLCCVTAATIVLGGITKVIGHITGHYRLLGVAPLFDLGEEHTFPTWFESFILLVASVLCGLVSSASSSFRGRWRGLSLFLFAASMDEVAGLHDRFNDVVHLRLDTQSFLYYPFVIPGAIAGILILVFYGKVLAQLPAAVCRGILLAGILFGTGVVGVEMLEGYWFDRHATSTDAVYQALVFVEESLEMMGVMVLIHSLIAYLKVLTAGQNGGVQIRFVSGAPSGELKTP